MELAASVFNRFPGNGRRVQRQLSANEIMEKMRELINETFTVR
jgi:hypothetical protein